MSLRTANERVRRSQEVLAHAWMVRTFIKHCDEVEDFPELMHLPRTVFDLCRAVEHLTDRPAEYLRILRKKLSRLRKAVTQFEHDAPLASAHTNFQQAVISIRACLQELLDLTTVVDDNPVHGDLDRQDAAADQPPEDDLVEADDDVNE